MHVIHGQPLPGYRWYTLDVWRGGVKLGPVTVQWAPAVDVSVLSRWRVVCR